MKRGSRTGAFAVAVGVGAFAVAALLWQRWFGETNEVEVRTPQPVKPETPLVEQEDHAKHSPLQLAQEGTGDLFNRRYRVEIDKPQLDAKAVMHRIYDDIDWFVPTELATFEKTKGSGEQFAEGDEYMIHITGPWDGPVRTIKVEPMMFAFATLEGHLEAGEIHFRAADEGENRLRFEIESWARSKDLLVDLAYDKAGLAKSAQTSMWVLFCRRVAEASGGELIGEVDVTTVRRPVDEDGVETA